LTFIIYRDNARIKTKIKKQQKNGNRNKKKITKDNKIEEVLKDSSVSPVFPLEEKPKELGNRSRIEILASILDVAHNGALKTHIMYKANLSHRQLEKYLGFLMQNAMILKVTDEKYGGTMYRVAEKGIEFLKDYARLSVHLNATEL